MTYSELISAISKLEGKKVQTSVGNVREVIKCLSILMARTSIEAGTSVMDSEPTKALLRSANSKRTEHRKKWGVK